MIRYVQECDREFWLRCDRHLPLAVFEKKVRDQEGYVLLKDGVPVGLLRYHLFWDNTPFCAMLYVEERFRGAGLGSELMRFWEEDMKAQGYEFVLTSSQADETAQHFYRKLGYRDCGGFLIDVAGYEQPTELMFIKRI